MSNSLLNLVLDETVKRESDKMRQEYEQNFHMIKEMFPEMFAPKVEPRK